MKLRPLLDARDRQILGTAFVLLAAFVVVLLVTAGTLGLAVRIFTLAAFGG